MKKQFINLGKALNKAEQKQINGGVHICALNGCPPGYICKPVAPYAGCIIL